ncbi:11961_t:CDS:2, partial [Funneliformis geosporum]
VMCGLGTSISPFYPYYGVEPSPRPFDEGLWKRHQGIKEEVKIDSERGKQLLSLMINTYIRNDANLPEKIKIGFDSVLIKDINLTIEQVQEVLNASLDEKLGELKGYQKDKTKYTVNGVHIGIYWQYKDKGDHSKGYKKDLFLAIIYPKMTGAEQKEFDKLYLPYNGETTPPTKQARSLEEPIISQMHGNLDPVNIHPEHLLLKIVHKGITKFKDEKNPLQEIKDLLVKLCKDKTLLGVIKNQLKDKLTERFNFDKYQFERGGKGSGERAFQLLKNQIDDFDNALDAIYFSQFLLEKRLRFMKGKFEMEIFSEHILPEFQDTKKKRVSDEFLFERHINYDYRLVEIICKEYKGFGETEPQAKINRLEKELNKF